MKEAIEKIYSIVDDIQNENDRIYVYLKNGLIPKCEKSFYNKKIKSNNMAILKLIQAVLYLDESEEYQNENQQRVYQISK